MKCSVTFLSKVCIRHIRSYSNFLSVEEKTFKCHKNVLAGSCPYFDAMFASEMVETTMQEIQLHEISAEAMELLIDYCYTAQITIEERNVQQLLPAACLLQVENSDDFRLKFISP